MLAADHARQRADRHLRTVLWDCKRPLALAVARAAPAVQDA